MAGGFARRSADGVGVGRRWVTEPALPALVLAGAGVALAPHTAILTWAIIGGLAGYALSGSV